MTFLQVIIKLLVAYLILVKSFLMRSGHEFGSNYLLSLTLLATV